VDLLQKAVKGKDIGEIESHLLQELRNRDREDANENEKQPVIEPTCIEAKDLKKKVPTFNIMKKVD